MPRLVVTAVVWGSIRQHRPRPLRVDGFTVDWRFWALSEGAFIVYTLGGVSR